jgi:hypothetical protein
MAAIANRWLKCALLSSRHGCNRLPVPVDLAARATPESNTATHISVTTQSNKQANKQGAVAPTSQVSDKHNIKKGVRRLFLHATCVPQRASLTPPTKPNTACAHNCMYISVRGCATRHHATLVQRGQALSGQQDLNQPQGAQLPAAVVLG